MKLNFRNLGIAIELGSIFNGPGLIGHIGEGYWWHLPWYLGGFTLAGLGKVFKTITIEPNPGNMRIHPETLRPREWYPVCLRAYFKQKALLNAVGLANPGVDAVCQTGEYQRQTEPFMISFMAKGKDRAERVANAKEFVRRFIRYLKHFRGPVVLQVNFACPNTQINPEDLYDEVCEILAILRELGIPLVANFNAFVPVDVLKKAEAFVDAYWIANTIPWGTTDRIDWKQLEPSGRSPLPLLLGDVGFHAPHKLQEEQYERSLNKGGLSSNECLPLGLDKTREAREAGVEKPIILGNGIQSIRDVQAAYAAGATGVAIVTVAMVAPLRMRSIITEAHRLGSSWNVSYGTRKSVQKFQLQH